MKKVYCLFLLTVWLYDTKGQQVATLAGITLSSKEFIWFYKANHHGNGNVAYHELRTYLDKYIDFKLKAIEARTLGLDRDTSYLKEVREYEQTLRKQKGMTRSRLDYVFLMNEYQDAALMFNLTEKKIWQEAQNNEKALRSFYQDHIRQYGEKAFDEVRGKVIEDYQFELEKEWVETLRDKYPVQINEDEIKRLARP